MLLPIGVLLNLATKTALTLGPSSWSPASTTDTSSWSVDKTSFPRSILAAAYVLAYCTSTTGQREFAQSSDNDFGAGWTDFGSGDNPMTNAGYQGLRNCKPGRRSCSLRSWKHGNWTDWTHRTYAIGYIDAGHNHQRGFPEVSLQNPAGTWLTFGMAIEFGTSPAERHRSSCQCSGGHCQQCPRRCSCRLECFEPGRRLHLANRPGLLHLRDYMQTRPLGQLTRRPFQDHFWLQLM